MEQEWKERLHEQNLVASFMHEVFAIIAIIAILLICWWCLSVICTIANGSPNAAYSFSWSIFNYIKL